MSLLLPLSNGDIKAYVGGHYENVVTKNILNHLQVGNVMIDVGANVGYYTLLCSRKVGPFGKVVAIECDPLNAAILRKNVEINECDNVEIHQAAAGAENKQQVPLYLNLQDSRVHQMWNNGGPTLSVNQVKIDDLIPKGSRVDLIKMDVEGAEPFVMEGCRRIFSEQKHMVVAMEFCPHAMAKMGGDVSFFLDSLFFFFERVYFVDDLHQRLLETNKRRLLEEYGRHVPGLLANLWCIR
jgi:FkbM family methyltransferase